MKQHDNGKAELSRRKSNSKPLGEKEVYLASTYTAEVYDEDEIPGKFDSHPLGWAASHPQASTKPLITYCTNEWKTNTRQGDYRGSLDSDLDEEEEEWYDYCLACLRSRTTRRWAMVIVLLFASLLYLYKTITPRMAEDRMLTESLQLRDQIASGKVFGGLFGNNVRPSFPDMIHMKTLDKGYLPSKHNSRRLVFVGDIHGCKEELVALLKEVHFDPKKDHLVTTGDMIAKGPDSLGTVDLLREMGASCVRGNNEDRILLTAQNQNSAQVRQSASRHRDGAAMEKTSSPPSRTPDESLSAELNADQIAYLQSCPVILQIGHLDALHGDVVVVHAGLVPGVRLQDQDPIAVMTMRTIDLHSHVPSKDGREGPGPDGRTKPQPPDRKTRGSKMPARKWPYNVHWTKLWNKFQKMLPDLEKWRDEERMVVVYGHDSRRGLELESWTKGLDSACVSGGRLTALVVGHRHKMKEEGEVVSVKCRDYRT